MRKELKEEIQKMSSEELETFIGKLKTKVCTLAAYGVVAAGLCIFLIISWRIGSLLDRFYFHFENTSFFSILLFSEFAWESALLKHILVTFMGLAVVKILGGSIFLLYLVYQKCQSTILIMKEYRRRENEKRKQYD